VIDPDAYARLLCDWCLEAKPGQQIIVVSTTLAEPALLAIHRELLHREAFPLLRIELPSQGGDFYRHATARQLDAFAPLELTEIQQADAWIRIGAPANLSALAGIDPELIGRNNRTRQPIVERRLAGRWCGTIWPTPALAQQAGMSERDYEAFVNRALFLDTEDPVAAWQALSSRQATLLTQLADAQEIRIRSDGTDLRLSVAGRTWINSDGRRNMPSGEVFTGPHERSATGTVRFDVPSSFRGGGVSGAELTFVDGEVVAARADTGQPLLEAALASDEGARYLGELGIGTNRGIDRATGSTLLDEKIAGTVHLALGRSYPETGGTNVSALHWDLICDLRSGGELSADGQPLVRDGAFVQS
jgi:aminopeptidase